MDLQIGKPNIILLPATPADHSATALATARVLLQLRPVADASALGTVRVAGVTLRASLACVPGQPASVTYDWSKTTPADVVLAGSPDDPGLRALIALVIGKIHGVNPVSIANNAAFRFLFGGGGNLVSAGLNLGGTGQGTWDQLNLAFLGAKDWALALGRDYFLAKVREGMRARWHSLPPPYGPSPVLLSDQVVCTADIFGQCIDHSRQLVYLDRFEISLCPGSILFSGTARAVTEAWYVPDVSADFSFTCTVSLDTNQQLVLTMGTSHIDFNEWYAQVFDWLSFGALQDVVKKAFQEALLSDQSQRELSGLFSSSVIGQLAAIGKSVDVTTTPKADGVAVLADAVIFSGSVSVADTSRSPVADLVVLRREGDPDVRVFLAGGSWAPGGDLIEVDWDFGDGTTLIQQHDDVRLEVEHHYQPGEFMAKLRAVDRTGRTFSCSTLVRVGLMSMTCPSTIFERTQSPIPMAFNLAEDGNPLEGVTVTLSGGNWQTSGTTGQNGAVSLLVDPARFVPLAQPYANNGWWVTHSLTTTAVKTGYRSETLTLFLADRMLQLRGDSLIGSAKAASLSIEVYQGDAPVAGATVVVTGKDNWQTQASTPANGWVQCAVGSEHFIPFNGTTSIGNGCYASAYVLVDASKAGYHPAAQKTVYIGFALPDNPVYQAIRERFEKWWLWSLELSTAIDRGDPFDSRVVSALPDVLVSVSAFRDALVWEADPSALPVLSLGEMLGVTSEVEGGLVGRIESLGRMLEKQLVPVKEAAGKLRPHAEIHRTAGRIRPIAMKESWPAPAIATRWRERSDRLLATAEVTARLRPSAANLPDRCRGLLGLFAKISALERLPSRFLPIAELLGMARHISSESPANRVEELLVIAQKNIDALSANEKQQIRR